MGLEEGGLSQDTSVLVKAGAGPERERDALTATTSPKWLPVKALKKEKRQRCLSERDSLPSLLSG